MNINNPARPRLLTWLCIASFITGCLWICMFLVLMLSAYAGNVTPHVFPGLVIEYLQAGYLFLVVLIALTFSGILGVFWMWRKKKSGFYLYALSKVILYFLPVLVIGFNHLNFPALFLTSALITFYGVFFTGSTKKLKKNQHLIE